jgi:uncharacterized protein
MSYEIKTGKDGKVRFNMKATNGLIILSSEGYSDKAGALGGIQSVRNNGGDDANFERKVSSNGQPYFVLKSRNGEVIGQSEMYSTTPARDAGIESVKKNCSSTDVKDV